MNTPLLPELTDYHLVFELRERRHQVVFNDHLALHILELARFKKSAAELRTPLDRWLYFLVHGERFDLEALPSELDDPSIRRALGVLQAMDQSAIERERYEARRKYQHDMATWLGEAHDEGLKRGELIGRIQVYQRVLSLPIITQAELRSRPIEELERLAADLEAELTNAPKSEN